MLSNELAALLARDLARLVQELKAFPDDASLWRIAPGVTNSAGNLALHLEGNLREYVGRQLGGVDFKRDRPSEFSRAGHLNYHLGQIDYLRRMTTGDGALNLVSL